METKTLTTLQSGEISVAAGLGSAMVNHPFNVMRARFQNRLLLSAVDRASYSLFPTETSAIVKGFTATFYSQLASTTFQTFFKNAFKHDEVLSKCSPIAGGVVTAILATPMESCMLRQSKTGSAPIQGGTLQQCWQFYQKHGFKRLYLGYSMTAVRSCSVGSGFSLFMPIMTTRLEEQYGLSRGVSLVVSGAVVGTFMSTISQPAEALRIEQQFTADEKSPFSIRQATRSLWSQGGWRGLFKGGNFRIPRTAPGIFVMGAISQQMEEHFLKR